MQRFIVYVYFIKFIGITHFVYSGILLLYLIKQHIHQPFIRQWGNYGDSSNTLITLNLNITSSKILFAIATDITNNGNPQGAYLGYDVIENNKIRFLFDATPWTFAWFCISK